MLFVILKALIGTGLLVAAFCGFLLLKSENAYHNRTIIIYAIMQYRIENRYTLVCQVCPSDMEPYEKTVCRLWDWGYTRILPKEKFEIIKPYIH